MHDFLVSILPVSLFVITGIQLLFVILSVSAYQKSREILFLLTALVAVGLTYDSLMLALGGVISEGAAGGAFKTLSQFRFVSHGALIPLLFPISGYALKLKKTPMLILWIFTGLLIVAGIAEGFCTVLEMRTVGSVIRYASSDATPAWAGTISSVLSYGTVLPLIVAGIIVIIKQKTPHLFLSGFLMFAFSALGPATGNFDLIFFISMFGEVCMILFFFLYAKKRSRA